MIVVKGGGKTSAPAVTRRKDTGRITVRPISFQRDKRVQVRPRRSLRRGGSRTARGKRPPVNGNQLSCLTEPYLI